MSVQAGQDRPAIAVVGMSGVFPKAVGADQFWRNMIARVDGTVEIPAERGFTSSGWIFSDSPAPDYAYSKRACLVQGFDFDPDGYALPADVLSALDPLHQWALFAARDAFENAESAGTIARRRCGVILAAIALPTARSSMLSRLVMAPEIFKDLKTRQASVDVPTDTHAFCARVVSSPAALIANALELKGGGYTLDAACASSLYALKLACDKLQKYEADLMLTGGVSGADTLYTQIGFSQLNALSRSGRCAPFDHRADGLVVGEGAGILVLKRLEDALADNDTIYGIIRGIGLSNDMRGNLLAPESAGQLRAMQAAYEAAGWLPSDVDYIECHGAGTPVGDTTELASLKSLWQDLKWQPGQCALGAVKSLVGHLLTGAGAAGMMRTLLALHHKTLPPTLNFEKPAPGSPLLDSPFQVPKAAAAWDRNHGDKPRRAAVSAFGFGGINAHVLIEGFEPEDVHNGKARRSGSQSTAASSVSAPDSQDSTTDIAIVGLETYLGGLTSLQAFEEAVFNGRPALVPVPPGRWKAPQALQKLAGGLPANGGFIPEIPVAMGEFQIPPGELPDILPQQLLMLKASAGAMLDAGLPLREMRTRMGTVIGIAFDYEATNFHLRWSLPQMLDQYLDRGQIVIDSARWKQWLAEAREGCGPPLTSTRTLGALGGIVASRVAREFRFGGPSFVVSAEEASGLRALEIAIDLLQSGQTDAMLVGAVDLHCDERNLATLHPRLALSPSNRIAPFDRAADGTLPGEGAVALVLKRLEDALADSDRIYAVVKGMGSAGGGGVAPEAPSVTAYTRSLQQALDQARVAPHQVTLMEAHAAGIPVQDDAEAEALHAVFIKDGQSDQKSTAVGTLKPLVGHCGAASGLASLAKAALCLHHQMTAPAVNYQAPRQTAWQQGPFYFPNKATHWAHNRSQGPRHAGVAALTHDGLCMHVVLSQAPTRPETQSRLRIESQRPMGALPCSLFRVQAESESELLKRLDELCGYPMDMNHQMEALAHEWFKRTFPSSNAGCNLAIVADSPQPFRDHIEAARQAVRDRKPCQLSRHGGVVYFPQPETFQGKLALVFPGSGNHYLGMGRGLAAHWPAIMQHMDADTEQLQDQLLPHLYDPRRSDWTPGWQSSAYQELVKDPLTTIFGQVLFGGQMTGLLKAFGIAPDAVIGYSLGESAGLFAMGAWPDRGQMLSRLQASDLFKDQLAGPCAAVRRAWQLPDNNKVQWHVAAVNRPAEVIDDAIGDDPYVRRLIINTPEECVIGGLKEHVDRIIARLGCDAVVLDGVVAVHCDAAQPVARAYKELHCFETTPVAGVDFYSCAWGKSYPLTSESAAESILHQALHGFDFPATIEQAYADGVRVFIEVGPHASCTRMIDQILAERPHLAVAANNRSQEETFSLLNCLATLAAAGIPVDLKPLYGDRKESDEDTGAKTASRIIRVPVGGRAFSIPSLPVAAAQSDAAPKAAHIAAPVSQSDTGNIAGEISFENILKTFDQNVAQTSRAHDQFLKLSEELRGQLAQSLQLQHQLLAKLPRTEETVPPAAGLAAPAARPSPAAKAQTAAFSREQCLEFAIGSAGEVLGPDFAIVDTFPARVRLPDEPLMLVDRILSIHGLPRSLGSGRIVTEHDVLPGAWYLDGGRAPVCISVEAGQADLFLSAYLGIDHHVQGRRTYRLLDARIVFHRGLPQPGETIRYDIHIDKFVRQGETYLFFFRYEGFIGDEHLITMTDGCAGFFTEQEVRQSGGIFLTDEDRRNQKWFRAEPFRPLIPLADGAFHDDQIDALRRGDAHDCFGDIFQGVHLPGPMHLPYGRMHLIHRIVALEPHGGRFGKGYIKAEADIHPQDWFLTCHFVDDMVMPGTLMYECCAHTLRVLLLRLGWAGDKDDVCYEPVPGVPCRLKCRGPVTPATRNVHYAVEIKEIGYKPEPYVITDAHMYADGHYIVFFKDMSMQLTGLTRQDVESFWRDRPGFDTGTDHGKPSEKAPATSTSPLFTRDHILAFAVGSPSKAFGEPYAVFDQQRTIARLPGPPYCFIDRIVEAEPQPWVLQPGGWVTAQYDVPADAWYFGADRSGVMPFAVLLEIALQPCGWLAAYLGSALKSDSDLKFRNLGGQAVVHANILPANRTLTMRTRLTKVSEAAEMVIEHFDYQVLAGDTVVYEGTTYFGFFTSHALSQQKGLQEPIYEPGKEEAMLNDALSLPMNRPAEPDEVVSGKVFEPNGLAMPARALAMVDTIEAYAPDGGPHGLGFVRGSKQVDAGEWFFKAHFFQDPVCPGSLGIESFLQLIKYVAIQRWPDLVRTHRFEMLTGHEHQWSYRGQVIPDNKKVTVDMVVKQIEDGDVPVIVTDGWLHVDGLSIYKMTNFGLRLVPVS